MPETATKKSQSTESNGREVNLRDPSLYINRELSWLEFNRRVLEEALDTSVPLMERLKFIAIFYTNFDEFFMVRVGGLQQKTHVGVTVGSGADAMPPKKQLERIRQIAHQTMLEAYRCLNDEILPALVEHGITIRGEAELTREQRAHLREVFRREIFPVLTPLAIDEGHPFPHLQNETLNLAVILHSPRLQERQFAVVQVPSVLERFVSVKCKKNIQSFVPLETVIRMHLAELFPGMKIDDAVAFRVTRNSEYEIDDDDVEDLLKAIEDEMRKRRRAFAVRLEIEDSAPSHVLQFLMHALDLTDRDVYSLPGLIDLSDLFQIYGLRGYSHLRDPQFVPQSIPEFTSASSIWSAIRARDILIHHPYESFGPVTELIETAAEDPRVLAIKQTLYRTSSDSPIVKALQRAADLGKQVTAVIELKARMDEELNIQWARSLEKAGVHVVFGFVGLKTHCKAALVVRREDDGIRRYVHLGTGNYNPQTARVYTDLGYFTCNADFCDDVSALFNHLTGFCDLPKMKKLVVAPSQLQDFMLGKIQQEIDHQLAGREGKIIAKINGLLEPTIVRALYKASQAGVTIELLCRGICALRPNVPGVSDHVRVVSIIDRFLEHSRVYYFHNDGSPQVYIGSADLMDRNLLRRIEVLFPVDPEELTQRLIKEVLAVSLSDNCKARELQADGSYVRIKPAADQPKVRSQQRFLEIAEQNAQRKIDEALPDPLPAMISRPRRNRMRKANRDR